MMKLANDKRYALRVEGEMKIFTAYELQPLIDNQKPEEKLRVFVERRKHQFVPLVKCVQAKEKQIYEEPRIEQIKHFD